MTNNYPKTCDWQCVQSVRCWFEWCNAKMRRHLAGDKPFFHLAKQITKRQDSRLDGLQAARRVRDMDAPNQELALRVRGQPRFLGLYKALESAGKDQVLAIKC